CFRFVRSVAVESPPFFAPLPGRASSGAYAVRTNEINELRGGDAVDVWGAFFVFFVSSYGGCARTPPSARPDARASSPPLILLALRAVGGRAPVRSWHSYDSARGRCSCRYGSSPPPPSAAACARYHRPGDHPEGCQIYTGLTPHSSATGHTPR